MGYNASLPDSVVVEADGWTRMDKYLAGVRP